MASEIGNSPSSAADPSQTEVQKSDTFNSPAANSDVLPLPNDAISPQSLLILSNDVETLKDKIFEKEVENSRLQKETEEWEKKIAGEMLETERLTKEHIKLKENISNENIPARKNAEVAEDFKSKQIAEKLKQLEKEKKNLQEHVNSLEIELAAKDDEFKTLHEKLNEERKARLEEQRPGFRKPPLPVRMPLRKITNLNQPGNGSTSKPMARRVTIGSEIGSSTSMRTPQPRVALIPRRGIRKSDLYGESSKFMSPDKYAVGVSLQRKPLLWSPLIAKTGSLIVPRKFIN